jgi:hypothetical protein
VWVGVRLGVCAGVAGLRCGWVWDCYCRIVGLCEYGWVGGCECECVGGCERVSNRQSLNERSLSMSMQC